MSSPPLTNASIRVNVSASASASVIKSAVEVEKFVNMKVHPFKGAWSAFKDWLAPTMTSLQIYNHIGSLGKELFQAMNESCSHLPKEAQQAFKESTEAMVHDVLADCMTSMMNNHATRSNEVKKTVFDRAADRARTIVDQHLKLLHTGDNQPPGPPTITEVWVQNPADRNGPKVKRLLVMRAAPPIENLVLRGGGAKGLSYPPALRALENLGRLSELKMVVGTSAGAMTALCLASGMSAKAFQRLSNETNTMQLLTTPHDFKERYPEVDFGILGIMEGGKALEMMDRACSGSVASNLRDHWEEVESSPPWERLTPNQQQRVKDLRDKGFEDSPRTENMVTFQDLHMLHQLAPTRFKELVLTGYSWTRGKTVYFSANTHPNMAVALAGRVSMSLPCVFTPVQMKLDGNGKVEALADGGIGSNMPSEVILGKLQGPALDEGAAKTLLMTFDEQGKGYALLHGSQGQRNKIAGGLVSNLMLNARDDAEKVHFSGANVLPVFHGSLETMSFAAPAAVVEQAQTQAMLKTLEYIDNTMGQARHDLVQDETAAVQLMLADDQQRFLDKHGEDMNPESLNKRVCDAIRAQRPPVEEAAVAA